MRKPMMFIGVMFVLVIVVGCSQPPTSEPAVAAATVAPTRFAPARTTAGVGGILAPRGFVELSVTSSGVVSDVLVAEGDQVQAGQVLVRLNDTRLKLAVAEANLKLSQAELNLTQVQKPADPADLDAAQRAVYADQLALTYARAVYSSTLGSQPIPLLAASQQIAQRSAQLAASQAHYEALKRLPEADQVKDAQLAVELAQLTLEQARVNLDDALVRAPVAGMVAEVQLKVGQWVAPGTPSITLADTGGWVVDTSLTESSIMDLQRGQRAKVKFNAIPGLEMTGHVESISFRAQDQQGAMIYIARVALDGSDPRLHWGMGTVVQFEKQE